MNTKKSLIIASAAAGAFILVCLFLLPQPKPMKFSGAMKALQFWNAQRAYPGDQIDDQKFFSAFERQRFEKSSERQLT